MNDIAVRIREKTEEVQKRIYRWLPEETNQQRILFEAMNYSVQNGGKRLRPMLIQETYRFFGGDEKQLPTLVEPFMAAMEMIHSYSLVHDDLPAMDNDDYRRGKLTTHKRYGEDVGILAGDALLNYAYETALLAEAEDEVVARRMMRALRVLARKAGAYGMVGGQTVDVTKTGNALTEEEIDFIYRLKTGALLEAAMMIGAILAGADETEVAAIEQIAAKVGMAFQIQDDILDLTSTQQELGKPVHSDVRNEKTTYVTLHGMEESTLTVERLSDEAVKTLLGLKREGKDDFLHDLIVSLVHRRN